MRNIVFDLDGTILENDNSLSVETLNCIKRISKNNLVTIATGRSLIGLPPSVTDIKHYISFYITSNGTTAYNADLIPIYKDRISPLSIKTFLKKICNHDELIVEVLIDGCWHIDDVRSKELKRVDIQPRILEYIEKTRVKHSNLFNYLLSNRVEIEKISINLCSPISEQTINQVHLLCKQFNLKYFSDNPHKIDVFKKTTSKASALLFLCNFCKINSSDIISFGNDENDIDMFKLSEYAICMPNTPMNVKRFANIKLRNNDSKRIGRALKLLKIKYDITF